MNTKSIIAGCILGMLGAVAGASAQGSSPGHVNYVPNASSKWDALTISATPSQQQWMLQHFANMVVYMPFFDARTAWYPRAYGYTDLYGIQKGSWEEIFHPEWILHDQNGNRLYMPFNCGGGTCAMWAADISNPAFRKAWIANANGTVWNANYLGLFVDDVNLEFRVSDGSGNQVAPVDFNTGQPMSWDAWRGYMATFVEELRAAVPGKKIMHNSIWFAGPPGVQDADPAVQRQIAAADMINLERGVASDPALTGGTGFWSVYSFLNFVDRLHAAGKGVNYQQYALDPAGQQYGLASYYLISNGNDSIGDDNTTPANWWTGYDTELGTPLGPRFYNNGVFQRDFSGGKVLLGEPGLSPQTVNLGGVYTTLAGNQVSSVTIAGWQGIVLLATGPVTSTGSVTRYLSDVTPTYALTGYGIVQKDVTVVGQPLTLSGVTYQKGIGVHAYSELHYPLTGGCSSLTATVGVDDEVPSGQASITFQVWADGLLLYNSGFLSSGTPSQPVNVDLTGRQNLGLVVTNGIFHALPPTTDWDHGDWANAIITCAH